MISCSSRARRLAGVLAVSIVAFASAAARADADTLDMIAQRGFGDRQNSYAWAMQWFNGKLYVGTARNEWCVENAVAQFYFKFQDFYKTRPFQNVHCTADPYALDLRAEIWQYTPGTGRWLRVYRSPADIPNPRERGKLLARDIGFRGMTVMRDRLGRQALFVSGVTANEYIPELGRRHPPRLLRTYDGTRFHDISRALIVKRSGGFPSRRPIGYRGLRVWRNQLYVVASTALAGDGAVFKVGNPFGRRARFTQVTPPDMHVFELETFDGDLYVGTGSYDRGYGVYKTRRTRAPFRFQPVVTDGAGTGTRMISVVSMHPFRGHLYVAAVTWYNWDRGLPATEMIRIGRQGRWEVVTGDPRPTPDGRVRYPISGLPPGFGNAFNAHIWRMIDVNGTLYAGTLDWSWFLQDSEKWSPEWSPLINGVLSNEYGFDLWASCDGVDWLPVTRRAFGRDPKYDFGVRGLTPGWQGFFVGSANHAFGTRIWYARRSDCGSSTTARAAAAPGARGSGAPRHLLTDVQRDGIVLSWEPSGGAARYRVERAAYVAAPLRAAGRAEVRVPVRMHPVVLGTTSRPDFVDRTRQPGRRYEYQVFAVTGGGGRGVPSNVQLVPDPRPAATFEQLRDAASGSRASAAAIGRMDRLRGGRSVARLERLSRTARDDEVRQLAYRLARRLRYDDVAGGPAKGG
jgi:hypothetical protein